MSHASLTARYRPQTFAEVAGQETVKAILSRAAQENRVAPAYLFSGTRGVGKTTIARIFAKALNCATAPTAEPCNTCEQCRKVTQGMHVDVVEIDGASNRGIDDAKRLKEAIGYAPMEGRYKVFIIDEAHMLTREAFNALLKTLEEPPARVTFVLATTEPHKFPVTIVSRCQHFTFTRLSEAGLEAHLTKVLGREGVDYDPAAVRLIARRAAGSVRDSMSLLGQVLALGESRLTIDGARGVLGLAGQELFLRLMEALAAQDCLAVANVVRELLDRGVDMGFFLRELVATWRNLFMLRQAGEAALASLDLPEDEARQWLGWAKRFEPAHIHACWQMTLEGQRRVLTSLEPAMALELLLLNLAMLPRLIPVESLRPSGGGTSAPSGSAATGPATGGPASNMPSSGMHGAQGTPPSAGMTTSVAAPATSAPSAAPSPRVPWDDAPPTPPRSGIPPRPAPRMPEASPTAGSPAAAASAAAASAAAAAQGDDSDTAEHTPSGPRTWDGFLEFCQGRNGQGGRLATVLRQTTPEHGDDILRLATMSSVQYERLTDAATRTTLAGLVRDYFGDAHRVEVHPPTRVRRTEAELRKEAEAHPAVQLLKEEMGACILKCTPLADLRRPEDTTEQGDNKP
ncbi:MAG TPA: DNA polymerase III subunit gamma/tau [Desulfovibrio sp.]|nr:DNA polymerase III subunit gamma/tau [Desulfovibrio sp.]